MDLFVNLYIAQKATLTCCYYFTEVQKRKAKIKIEIIKKYPYNTQVLILYAQFIASTDCL